MTDKKISELTNITGANLADTDEFVVVDTSATETKAITWGELKEGLDTSTGFVRITGDTMTGDLTVPNIITSGNVDGRDVSADGTKLDGIEAGADVTDTTNVTAAGALMDSELTNITAVKALNQGVATTDSPTFAGQTINGNITVTGTVDGRDVAADGALAASAVQPGDNISTLTNDSGYLTGITGQSIKNLSDVYSTMSPTDGQVLTYDTTNGWQAETAAGTDLAAIAESKAVTAVDVFVYDTSKDSDGGAWRKRCQHTSWYNETLNTATRGSRREFPAVAVIVAEATKVTIYDGDDPSLPMWMVFTVGTYPNFALITQGLPNSLSAVNGIICVGGKSADSTDGRVFLLNMVADNMRYAASGVSGFSFGLANANGSAAIIQVSSDLYLGRLVSPTVNDVAMTVLPDAPIDPATGLPVPTIAVATDGGVSVIKDDGTVVDITGSSGAVYSRSGKVEFLGGDIVFGMDSSSSYSRGHFRIPIPTADRTVESNSGSATDKDFGRVVTGLPVPLGTTASDGPLRGPGGTFYSSLPVPAGVTFTAENEADRTKAMVAYITSTYNTGWMPGDIKGAFLSDTDDTDLVGGTDADRSVNGNDLTVNGTVTRSAVATGAELVAYSGFSASNYLEQPYNSDLDFGTGDFCVMGWYYGGAANQYFLDNRDTGQGGFALGINSASRLQFIPTNSAGSFTDVSGTDTVVSPTALTFFTGLRRNGICELYANGKLLRSQASAIDVNGTAPLIVGAFAIGGIAGPWQGSLALLRISATAPTAEQIAKIYNDEKVLFQENAAATLYGASDAVTALAHDPDTNLLHVGTSAGRSVFQGLRRVSNTTTAVGTAISASNSLVVEE